MQGSCQYVRVFQGIENNKYYPAGAAMPGSGLIPHGKFHQKVAEN
jgi:hypothetical protein